MSKSKETLRWGERGQRVGVWLSLDGEGWNAPGINLHRGFHRLVTLAAVYQATVDAEITDKAHRPKPELPLLKTYEGEPLRLSGDTTGALTIKWELEVDPSDPQFEELQREVEEQMVEPIRAYAIYLLRHLAQVDEREHAYKMQFE